jgi:hypothetical protein
MANPCGGGTDSGGTAPAPTATVDAAAPPSAPEVFQSHNPSGAKVDPKVSAAQALDGTGCNRDYGDTLLGFGWTIADAAVSLNRIHVAADSSGRFTQGALYTETTVPGAHAFSLLATCLRASVSTTTVGVTAGYAPPGKSATAVSGCPDGRWLVGGAFTTTPAIDIAGVRAYPHLTKLGPEDNAWIMRARGPAAGTASFSTTAICAQEKTEVLYPYPVTTFSVPPGGTVSGTASCPAGYTPYSGGFAMDDNAKVDVLENRPGPALLYPNQWGEFTSWVVTAASTDTVARDVNITMLCGKTSDTAPPAPTFTTPIPDSPPADPVISIAPSSMNGFCSNGSWPTSLTVKNTGGGNLAWTATKPAAATDLTVTPASGVVAAGATQSVALSGTYGGVASFVLSFASNGGASDVTVTCQ